MSTILSSEVGGTPGPEDNPQTELLDEPLLPEGSTSNANQEGGDMDQNQSYHSTSPHKGPVRTAMNPTVSLEDDTDRQLKELEEWHEKAAKLQKIARLREAKAKYISGDENALQLAKAEFIQPMSVPTAPTGGLPRPEPPQLFTKRNRGEYNRWKRDCERYFDRLPINFPTNSQKVDFGAQYLSEAMKSLWEAYRIDQTRVNALYQPTWEDLKAVMLGSLGTPSERRQRAYEAIVRAKMLPNKGPTGLLDYMRPFWEELGSTHGPELQLMEYIHALPETIQKQLFMYPEERRHTLTQVEEVANMIYRQLPHSKIPSEKGYKEQEKGKDNFKRSGGHRRPQKKLKSDTPDQNDQKQVSKAENKPLHPTITCYHCGIRGHTTRECKKLKAQKEAGMNSEAGKGAGQK